MSLNRQQLLEKWAPVLDHPSLPKIQDQYRRETTAIVLENQEQANIKDRESMGLYETAPANVSGTGLGQGAAGTGGVQGYDPVLISLVRRSLPQLMAYDVLGVQPLTQPSGLIFAMRSRYTQPIQGTPPAGDEALYNKPVKTFSGPHDTTTAEGLNPEQMAFSIERTQVVAKSRMLKAEYSIELAQDLQSVHGLNAEAELSTILSHEILAEINREVIETLQTAAVPGCQTGTTVAGTFDLDTDSNGRWSVEKFKGLMFQIEREANIITQQTRRGRGNFIICSSDVASALAMAGVLDYTPALAANAGLNVDESSTTFAGILNGKYKVYVDPYAGGSANLSIDGSSQYVVVGYKGTSAFDAGMFYCPYTALQMVRAVDPATFQPKLGFKTRYGIVSNPFSPKDPNAVGADKGLVAGNNVYYRKFLVSNLM